MRIEKYLLHLYTSYIVCSINFQYIRKRISTNNFDYLKYAVDIICYTFITLTTNAENTLFLKVYIYKALNLNH